MTREQLLQAFLEDEGLIEKGYLIEGQAKDAKWSELRNIKMVDVVKFAIEGVLKGENQAVMTRKINQFLEP